MTSREPGLSRSALAAIGVFPFAVTGVFVALLVRRETRRPALDLLEEFGPVELLTFLFLLAGGLCGLVASARLRRVDARRRDALFYAVFSLGLLFTAMEEIAWGQLFLGFKTPAFLSGINAQNELTLHNLRGLHGHSEFFRLAFGAGGLLGAGLGRFAPFSRIAPHPVLLPWFGLVTIITAIDALNDFVSLDWFYDRLTGQLSEVIELLIGIAGFLYVWLNERALLRFTSRR